MSDKLFFRGTLILTLTGITSRIMGFFYRIFLSHTIGAQGVGIYQLTLPVQGIILAAAATGIQAALSRLCASFTALEKEKDARDKAFDAEKKQLEEEKKLKDKAYEKEKEALQEKKIASPNR